MKTLFAATVLTAVLLSACDSAPLASPPVVAVAAAETAAEGDETTEEWLARFFVERHALCDHIQTTARIAYELRLEGHDRARLLAIVERTIGENPAFDPIRQLVILIAETPSAQLHSPAMPEVLSGLTMMTCERVQQIILINNLTQP